VDLQILKIGSRGPEVMLVQALLSKLGYDVEAIDGIKVPYT
jgi:g-D-glutamyl-meso-diaminopimelate peptidase